jgi:hypothetical protein
MTDNQKPATPDSNISNYKCAYKCHPKDCPDRDKDGFFNCECELETATPDSYWDVLDAFVFERGGLLTRQSIDRLRAASVEQEKTVMVLCKLLAEAKCILHIADIGAEETVCAIVNELKKHEHLIKAPQAAKGNG